MIQETSKQAYSEIQGELGERQLQVYNTIKKLEYCSNSMISVELKLPINQVTPRCNELRKKNLVVESHKTICPITRRRVIFWKLKLNLNGGEK